MTYKTITVELASDDLVRLHEGVTKYGHITMMLHSEDGVPVYLNVNGMRKGEKPRKSELRAYDPGHRAAAAEESH